MKCEEEKSRNERASGTFTVTNICKFLRRVYVCISTSVIFFFLSFFGLCLWCRRSRRASSFVAMRFHVKYGICMCASVRRVSFRLLHLFI